MKAVKRNQLFEAMENNFQLLGNAILVSLKGGNTLTNNKNVSWDCVFNCMEYLSNDVIPSELYYSAFMGTNPGYNPADIEIGGVKDVGAALSSGGFSYTMITILSNISQINGNQMIIIQGADGKDHAVIAKSISVSGIINYYDPTTSMSGSISDKNVHEIYDITNCTCPYVDSPISVGGGGNCGRSDSDFINSSHQDNITLPVYYA